MAAKVSWKGTLSFGIINVPVGAVAVSESAARISFNQMAAAGEHVDCKARIAQKRICSKCGREAKTDDIRKGYEFSKGQYLIVPDDELAKLKLESDRHFKIEAFIEGEIPPAMIDLTYFLVPDGKIPGPFFVIQKAMADKMAVGKIALQGREQLAVIVTDGNGFRMHTLTPANEVRKIEDQLPSAPVVNPQEVELAKMLVERLEMDEYDFTAHTDAYKDGVRKILDALIAGEPVADSMTAASPQASTGSMMDMLAASLAALDTAPKKQAKASLPVHDLADPALAVDDRAGAARKSARRKKVA